MQLIARWDLRGAFGLTELFAAATIDAAGLDERAAAVPWALSSSDGRLELAVGPVQWRAGALAHGLELFHHLREALAFALPAERVLGEGLAVRLDLPGGAPDEALVERVARLAAPLIDPVVDGAGAGAARIARAAGGLEVALDRSPVPGLLDEIVPLLAATVATVARDVAWGTVPREVEAGDRDALRRAVEPLLDVIGRRGHLDALARFAPDAPRAPAPKPAAAVAERPAGRGARLEIVPFRTGGRPLDEVARPGSGCSEFGGFLSSGTLDAGDASVMVLFRLRAEDGAPPPAHLEVRLSARFVAADGTEAPVPGLQDVPVPGARVVATDDFRPATAEAPYALDAAHAFVALLDPQAQLFPRPETWSWEDLPEAFRARVPDGRDPYTFASQFHQRVRVDLDLVGDGRSLGRDSTVVEIYDLQRFGSLYGRLLHLVAEDVATQQRKIGRTDVYAAHHPWYPVLGIGMNKADLYMRAIRDDVGAQTKHLANPRWLLRVGIYLELLTCCGIFELLAGEHPRLMTPAERRVLRESPDFAEIREMIDTGAWASVWALHEIVPIKSPLSAAGPVDFLNLMQKQKSTLGFLHAHHEDLKNAIELAGPELEGSQEAWHRVYRDAERAVVNSSLAAFPELRHLPGKYREFALWHTRGDFAVLPGGKLLPGWLTGAFGDQDGVYPSGARQYRASMNHVAEWARARSLMDYVGAECVPRETSLIEARLDGDEDRFASLQARDGYAGSLQAVSDVVRLLPTPSPESVRSLLGTVAVFGPLSESEREALARDLPRRSFVPGAEIVREGDRGGSLFVLESGLVEVRVAGPEGSVPVARLDGGSVFGEMSALTGEPRAATVRAVHYTTAFEIGRDRLGPVLAGNPSLVAAISGLLAARRAEIDAATGEGDRRAALGDRMRAWFGLREGAAEAATDMPVAEREALLGKVRLFQPLESAERAKLARLATPRRLSPGQAAVVEGDRGASLFVIASGRCEVTQGGRSLAVLGAGDPFGEMALMTGERRSATVKALEPTVVVELGKTDLFPVISHRPGVILQISEMLAERQAATADVPRVRRRDRLQRRIKGFLLG